MKRFVTRFRQISVKPFPFKQRRHALKKSASKLHISFPFVLTGIVYEGICPGIRDYQPHKQERCRLMKINNKLTDGTNSTAWLIAQSEHTCRASFTRNDQSLGIFQASARSLSNPTWNFRQCLQKRRKQMVSAEREAMMGWTGDGGGLELRPGWLKGPSQLLQLAKQISEKHMLPLKTRATFGNDEQSCRGVPPLFVDLSLRAAGTRHY